MSRVVDQYGAQVLPDVGDARSSVSAWTVHLACDGDVRLRVPAFARFAETVFVERAPE